jgi:succinate dehydrogenase / fumarate reductase cytochrome b subunit
MSLLASSLGKKYVMALSGLVLSLFVLGHLQLFGDPYFINSYGYKLQHLPYGLLWVIRSFLLLCVVAHTWAAITLKIQNKKARPEDY